MFVPARTKRSSAWRPILGIFASPQEGGPVLVGEGGLHYWALAVEADDGLVWFWVGSHSDYDNMVD